MAKPKLKDVIAEVKKKGVKQAAKDALGGAKKEVIKAAKKAGVAAGFGALLKSARKARGWSQAEAGAKVGYSEREIRHWEKGTRHAHFATQRGVLEILAAGG